MTTNEKDEHEAAIKQARAQLESVIELVDDLRAAKESKDYNAQERAKDAIHEDALCLEVRSGWYSPGCENDNKPSEYRILLCTGGPAVQIVGELNEHYEPETAELQCQDWFTAWQDVRTNNEEDAALLAYAQTFYFGE